MTECCTGKKPKHFFRDKGLGMMSFEKEKKNLPLQSNHRRNGMNVGRPQAYIQSMWAKMLSGITDESDKMVRVTVRDNR